VDPVVGPEPADVGLVHVEVIDPIRAGPWCRRPLDQVVGLLSETSPQLPGVPLRTP
jgi:hypothetical protein